MFRPLMSSNEIAPLRLAAFDKCPVWEIKNSGLLLGFAFQDIKDIKREITQLGDFDF